jgi:hypothetical protein
MATKKVRNTVPQKLPAGTKILSTKVEDFNGTTVPKNSEGIIVEYPSWRNDMVRVTFKAPKLTILFPIASIKSIN